MPQACKPCGILLNVYYFESRTTYRASESNRTEVSSKKTQDRIYCAYTYTQWYCYQILLKEDREFES